MRELRRAVAGWAIVAVVAACASLPPPSSLAPVARMPVATDSSATPGAVAPSRTPLPSTSASLRREVRGETPVPVGEPVDLASLSGRIVFDDFEDVYTMAVDGSDLRTVAGGVGPEFDGAWSPDGTRIVYRDSRRGVNEDDEIFVVSADGSNPQNLTNHPANDWARTGRRTASGPSSTPIATVLSAPGKCDPTAATYGEGPLVRHVADLYFYVGPG